MQVLFINKFIPADPAPTALLVAAVAEVVREGGGSVSFAGSHAGYRGLRPSGWRRWLHEAAGNLRLLWRSLTGPRPDIIVCLTDPPGSLVIAAVVAWVRRARLVHWVMDVYPQVAVALGALRAEGFFHRAMRAAMGWGLDRCDAVACLDEDMLRALGLNGDPRAFISTPWPQPLPLPQEVSGGQPSRVRWLYSGNLGRAHDYATLLRAQRRLEDAGAPFELVFQGGGPCREAAMQMAQELDLRHCDWADYVEPETLVASLLDAQVLVATQKPETRGLLWPSKLALMLLLPRPIAWVGPQDGAVAERIRQASPQHGVFTCGDDASLASWLMSEKNRLLEAVPYSRQALEASASTLRQQALETWRRRFEALCPVPCRSLAA